MKIRKIVLMMTLVVFASRDVFASGESDGGAAAAQGGITALSGIVMGGFLIIQGNESTGATSAMYYAMGALSFAGAAMSLATMAASKKTEKAFKNDSAGGGDTPIPDIEKSLENVNNQLADLEKTKGIKVNIPKGTITTPQGTFSTSAFKNGASMAKAGAISQGDIATVDETLKKVAKDTLKQMSIGVAGGGGGGGGGGSYSSSKYVDPYAARGGASVGESTTTGLTRTMANGDSIGSSTDNVFEMITRRYDSKSEEKIFIGQQ